MSESAVQTYLDSVYKNNPRQNKAVLELAQADFLRPYTWITDRRDGIPCRNGTQQLSLTGR